MLPGGPLLSFNPAIRFVPGDGIHFPVAVSLWSGKVEKFSCVVWRLDALRGLTILVSFLSFRLAGCGASQAVFP
jgi:hypothetical protein